MTASARVRYLEPPGSGHGSSTSGWELLAYALDLDGKGDRPHGDRPWGLSIVTPWTWTWLRGLLAYASDMQMGLTEIGPGAIPYTRAWVTAAKKGLRDRIGPCEVP